MLSTICIVSFSASVLNLLGLTDHLVDFVTDNNVPLTAMMMAMMMMIRTMKMVMVTGKIIKIMMIVMIVSS